jgi:adenylate cyclase
MDEAGEWVFIAMAHIEGADLRKKTRSGPLEPAEAVNIAIQIAEGLDAAHRSGTVHRDVKSANVMLTEDGRAIVTDFGLAKLAGRTQITRTNTAMGTAAYMSPEQARGDEVDHRTDIWSLGVCLYEMVTGRMPFQGDYEATVVYSILNDEPVSVSRLRPEVPLELESIIDKSMSKDVENRYQDMNEMLEELRSVLEGPRPSSRAKSPPSIAVLPFADMSAQKDQEYFCDGIAEEIINDLMRLEGLSVVARTSSFAFKGQAEDIRKIGRKLGAERVLEGSVRKAGNQLRITAQLVDVADGYHIWSAQYDRAMEDVFAIQEEIAQSIVEALEIRLTAREKLTLEKPATRNIDAYDFYLRGRKFFYQTKRENLANAREMFSKAIKKDPNYARAYAGMADCHSYLHWYFDRSPENLEKAMASSRKALELDPELAEAHAARGLAVSLNKQYDEAEGEFETAIQLNPKLFEAHYFYARTCFVQGKMEKAARLFGQACEVSPDDHQAPMLLGFVLKSMNLVAKAKVVYRRGLKKAEKYLEENPDDSRALYMASSAYADLGEKEKALQYSMRAVSLDPDDSYTLYGIVCNYCRLGELDEALYYFERALKAGFAHKEWIENDSDLDPIRNHPRFQELVSKLK